MYDSNDIGMLLLMGLPLGFLFLFNSGIIGRIISVTVILGVPATIALTGSRGALVGLAVVGPFLFIALARVNILMRLGSIAVIIAALNWAAPAGYWEQMETILNPSEDYNIADTNYGRVALAKRGVGYMYDRPIFGVGINNFARAEGTISSIARTAMAGAQIQWIAPHNTYVQVGAEIGFFGLLAWLTLLASGTLGLLWLRRRIPKSWEHVNAERRFLRDACLFVPLSVLGFAATSFFLSHAYTAPFYFLLVFIAGTHMLVRRELAADAASAEAGRAIPVWHGEGAGEPRSPIGSGATQEILPAFRTGREQLS
jgi:O-antigen ligase